VGHSPIVPSDKHAANALIELVNANQGQITIVALGPLTNIAVAITLDPTFLSKVKSIYCMGGCLHAKGNSNMSGCSLLTSRVQFSL
jgi:inosine-uridine nucleoside N-ribohydrolase